MVRSSSDVREVNGGSKSLGESIQEYMDHGNRLKSTVVKSKRKRSKAETGEYRARSPTRSERLNRALKELRPAAFKIHMLIWTWRGAPAKGNLPYFTIRSLEKFCNLTRPTVRKAFDELTAKGYIVRCDYNCHHKNSLYRLVPVRKIPKPGCKLGEAPR